MGDQEGEKTKKKRKSNLMPSISVSVAIVAAFSFLLVLPATSRSGYHCQDAMDLPTYFFLNEVCEDCFALYRDTDIYSACRSGYFSGCMDTLMVDKETQLKAARYIRATRAGNRRY